MHGRTLALGFAALIPIGGAFACGGDVVDSGGVADGWGDAGVPSDTVVDGNGGTSDSPGVPRRDGDGVGVTGGVPAPPAGTSTPPSGPRPPPPSTCGNGRLERGEQCDGRLLNGETCATATMNAAPGGMLRCSPDCVLDVSGCQRAVGPGRPGPWGGGGAYGGGGVSGRGGRPPIRRPPPVGMGGTYGGYYPAPPQYYPAPVPAYPPPPRYYPAPVPAYPARGGAAGSSTFTVPRVSSAPG